jgi:hypothetical protein
VLVVVVVTVLVAVVVLVERRRSGRESRFVHRPASFLLSYFYFRDPQAVESK